MKVLLNKNIEFLFLFLETVDEEHLTLTPQRAAVIGPSDENQEQGASTQDSGKPVLIHVTSSKLFWCAIQSLLTHTLSAELCKPLSGACLDQHHSRLKQEIS